MELTEEQKRARKAEERRKRANERYEKMKSSRVIPPPPANVSPMDINDADEFLAKFCIINPQKMEKYQRAFTRVDADKDGYLTIEEAMEAAKRSVPTGALGETDSQYLTMLLDLLNLNTYWMNVDFRIFAIIVSLAQKIAALDDYMRGIIDRFDFKSLDTKMWRARELFRQFIDNVENETMSMESLWTELKAGGVSYHHEMQVRKSLQHLKSLDVLDFLTYLPLFALTHTQIITNPLCDERII
uniref:EF-hand domain-containing protein n=2 Tax=Ciona intestinalis TaxID=7719 RepID=F7AA47_CIOIN